MAASAAILLIDMDSAESATAIAPILRYPGGKQRVLSFLAGYIPPAEEIRGSYVEPFVGGAAVFLRVRPRRAVLSDLNLEVVELYQGLKRDARGVWAKYCSFGGTKEDYHHIRALPTAGLDEVARAARTLYLNRTCFKGNWRQNSAGQFNVGYGGQSRRWVITEEFLVAVADALSVAEIRCGDFQPVLEQCQSGDFAFLDPPYRPGARELVNDHYIGKRFSFTDHQRLATVLADCSNRGITWCLTTSANPDILREYRGFGIVPFPPTDRGEIRDEVLILSKGAP